MSEQDWRETAYLTKDKWPEAIPPMGPKREYGPYPWGQISHENKHGVDDYPHSHPAAGSIGDIYMGDVCPMCGVPLRYDAEVVNIRGTRGELHAVSPDENPIPCYHPDCWDEREQTIKSKENVLLTEFTNE
jgi:hypothetical protein